MSRPSVRAMVLAPLLAVALAGGLGGCGWLPGALGGGGSGREAAMRELVPPLAAYFDCLRDRNETLVSAHRAGPSRGLPENAIETMAATLDAIPRAILEIDVARSRDGVLYLMHDDRLERTTTGTGPAAALGWSALSRLSLRDPDGRATNARPPRLADALALAVRRGAIVTLDLKRGVALDDVVAAVKTAGATRNAVIITYDVPAAIRAARAAPDLMISASIDGPAAWEAMRAAGVRDEQLLAWTGNETPDPDLISTLRAGGVEPMFGTLGAPGRRLDDRYLADGDPAEYAALARLGVVVIATDRPDIVAGALPRVTCRP